MFYINTPKHYSFLRIVFFLVLVFSLLACNKTEEEKSIDFSSLSWNQIEEQSRGQTVFFSAWAGLDQINQYIQWAAERLSSQYDITLKHVPNNGGIEAAHQIQEERAANKDTDGSIDIMWINGEAFRLVQSENLVFKNIYDLLPNKKYVNAQNKVLFEDFTLPTNGDEVPWGTAQLIFFYRAKYVQPFSSYENLIETARAHPGKFTYPQPFNDFTGLTLIKTLFYVFSNKSDTDKYYRKYTGADQDTVVLESNKIWSFLDTLHPHLWRDGKAFPKSYADMDTLYKDGEIDFNMAFNPYAAQNGIILKKYAEDTTTFLPAEGSIANAHFLAIPYNSSSKAAALVAINFLLSAEAQARKSNVTFWGDPSVLDVSLLSAEGKEYFNIPKIEGTEQALPPQGVGKATIKEFHATWSNAIQEEWTKRYLK